MTAQKVLQTATLFDVICVSPVAESWTPVLPARAVITDKTKDDKDAPAL